MRVLLAALCTLHLALAFRASPRAKLPAPRLLNMASQAGAQQSICILQNKGGGHGEIGFALARRLCPTSSASAGATKVTIVQDSSYKKSAQPFSAYPSLSSPHVTVVEAALSDTAAVGALLAAGGFTSVVDNNYKSVQVC